jgi:hypothetical protein
MAEDNVLTAPEAQALRSLSRFDGRYAVKLDGFDSCCDAFDSSFDSADRGSSC